MSRWLRLAGGLLVVAAVALAAQGQEECYDPPDPGQTSPHQCAGSDLGNPVVLTAVLVAGGVVLFAFGAHPRTASRRFTPLDVLVRRVLPGMALAASTYALALFAQAMYPNVDVAGVANAELGIVEEFRANLSVSLLLGPGPALAALAAVVLLVVYGAAAIASLAWRTLAAGPPRDPRQVLVNQALAATPLHAMLLAGAFRLLIDLPQVPGSGAFLLLLPAAGLAVATLAATPFYRLQQLQRLDKDSRWGPIARQAFVLADRLELAAVGILLAVAGLVAFLPAVPTELLENGRTFGASLGNHTQLLLLAAVPSLATWRANGRKRRALLEADPQEATGLVRARLDWRIIVAASAAALALAFLFAFVKVPMLVATMVVMLPTAGLAIARGRGAASAGILALATFTLWCLGNAIVAGYDWSLEGDLVYQVGPGGLALWRLAASIGVAACVTHALRTPYPSAGAVRRVIASALLALAANLELPLAAWTAFSNERQGVHVGSLVASQSGAVQLVFHVVAFAAVTAAVLALDLAQVRAKPAPSKQRDAKATNS